MSAATTSYTVALASACWSRGFYFESFGKFICKVCVVNKISNVKAEAAVLKLRRDSLRRQRQHDDEEEEEAARVDLKATLSKR